MTSELTLIQDLHRQAQLDRKRGDALRKVGREAEVLNAYEAAAVKLRECLQILEGLNWKQSPEAAALRAETLGSLAGILRRMSRNDEAVDLYTEGAKIECDFHLPSTYNRVNKLKYLLLTGRRKLRELDTEIRETADFLDRSLHNPQDPQLSDSAWTWADLGDCRALLGELDAAKRAYATFIKKADIKSPETTLDVLRSIAAELKRNDDPDGDRVTNAVSLLQAQLAAR